MWRHLALKIKIFDRVSSSESFQLYENSSTNYMTHLHEGDILRNKFIPGWKPFLITLVFHISSILKSRSSFIVAEVLIRNVATLHIRSFLRDYHLPSTTWIQNTEKLVTMFRDRDKTVQDAYSVRMKERETPWLILQTDCIAARFQTFPPLLWRSIFDGKMYKYHWFFHKDKTPSHQIL